MANICCTNFCITGEHDELQSAYNLLSSVEKNRKPGKSCWLGNIVNALGYDAEKYDCVGTFENVQFYGEVLSLDTDTAWIPMLDPFELLKKKLPSHRDIFQGGGRGMRCVYQKRCLRNTLSRRLLCHRLHQRQLL